MLRLDTYERLPWEKKADGRYWVHLTLGDINKQLKYYSRSPEGNIIERVEVVTEEGLFNKDSVTSLVGLPIVLVHTRNGYQLNRDSLRVGTILNTIGREDGKLIAESIIDDYRGVELIDKLLKNKQTPEASSAYSLVDLKKREDGIYEQFRGEYDHVAAPLLPGHGRGGSDIILRFDSVDDAVSDVKFFDLGGNKSVKRLVVRMDSKELTLEDPSPEVEEAIAYYQNRLDTVTSDLEGVEERLEELQKENDEFKERLDSQEEVDISKEIKIRMDTWKEVKAIAPNVAENYSLEPTEIIKLGLKEISPSLKTDSLDEATLRGIWQGINLRSDSNSNNSNRRKTDDHLNGGKRADSRDTRSDAASKYEQAHMNRRRKKNAN